MQLTEILKRLSTSKNTGTRPEKPLRNPYVTGLPVRDAKTFFDREEILKRIEALLQENGGRAIVYGGRRTGKTSLLFRIRDQHFGKPFIPVYVDMQAWSGTPVEAFLGALARGIRDACKKALPQRVPSLPSGVITCESLSHMLDTVLQDAGDDGLILLLDEYEVLSEFFSDLSIARQITAIFDSHPRLLSVFAGERMEGLRERNLTRLLDTAARLAITFWARETRGVSSRNPLWECFNKAFERMGYKGRFTPHGLRATASTILNEMGFRPDVIERQLAHTERNRIRAAYNQAEYLEERRRMMQQWADLIDGLVAGNVVTLHKAV